MAQVGNDHVYPDSIRRKVADREFQPNTTPVPDWDLAPAHIPHHTAVFCLLSYLPNLPQVPRWILLTKLQYGAMVSPVCLRRPNKQSGRHSA